MWRNEHPSTLKSLKKKNTEVQLIYSVVLVAGIKQTKLNTHTHTHTHTNTHIFFFRFSFPIGHHKKKKFLTVNSDGVVRKASDFPQVVIFLGVLF